MSRAAFSAAMDTMCPDSYAQYHEPRFIIRLVDHEATGTGSICLSITNDILTGSTYKAPAVEKLFTKGTSHIEEIGDILPPINQELDAFVDNLIDQAYGEIKVTPLTRIV